MRYVPPAQTRNEWDTHLVRTTGTAAEFLVRTRADVVVATLSCGNVGSLGAQLVGPRATVFVQVALGLERESTGDARIWSFVRVRTDMLLQHRRFRAVQIAVLAHVPADAAAAAATVVVVVLAKQDSAVALGTLSIVPRGSLRRLPICLGRRGTFPAAAAVVVTVGQVLMVTTDMSSWFFWAQKLIMNGTLTVAVGRCTRRVPLNIGISVLPRHYYLPGGRRHWLTNIPGCTFIYVHTITTGLVVAVVSTTTTRSSRLQSFTETVPFYVSHIVTGVTVAIGHVHRCTRDPLELLVQILLVRRTLLATEVMIMKMRKVRPWRESLWDIHGSVVATFHGHN